MQMAEHALFAIQITHCIRVSDEGLTLRTSAF